MKWKKDTRFQKLRRKEKKKQKWERKGKERKGKEIEKRKRGSSWEVAVKARGATWGLMYALQLVFYNIIVLEKRLKTKPSEHLSL